MMLVHQVIGQPADEEIEEIVSAAVAGSGSPERGLAEDGAKAGGAIDVLFRNGGRSRLPPLPGRQPEQAGESDGKEGVSPAVMGHQEAAAEGSDGRTPSDGGHDHGIRAAARAF